MAITWNGQFWTKIKGGKEKKMDDDVNFSFNLRGNNRKKNLALKAFRNRIEASGQFSYFFHNSGHLCWRNVYGGLLCFIFNNNL